MTDFPFPFPELDKRAKRIHEKENKKKHRDDIEYVKRKRKKVKEGKRSVRNYLEEM